MTSETKIQKFSRQKSNLIELNSWWFLIKQDLNFYIIETKYIRIEKMFKSKTFIRSHTNQSSVFDWLRAPTWKRHLSRHEIENSDFSILGNFKIMMILCGLKMINGPCDGTCGADLITNIQSISSKCGSVVLSTSIFLHSAIALQSHFVCPLPISGVWIISWVTNCPHNGPIIEFLLSSVVFPSLPFNSVIARDRARSFGSFRFSKP